MAILCSFMSLFDPKCTGCIVCTITSLQITSHCISRDFCYLSMQGASWRNLERVKFINLFIWLQELQFCNCKCKEWNATTECCLYLVPAGTWYSCGLWIFHCSPPLWSVPSTRAAVWGLEESLEYPSHIHRGVSTSASGPIATGIHP